MQNMKKQHITIITAVVGVLVIAWIIYSAATRSSENTTPTDEAANATSTTMTATSTATSTGTGQSLNGLTVSDVKVTGAPGSKAYLSKEYAFVFAYPEKDAVIIPVSIPASLQTPLLYRTDAEFAFCVKERKTSMGCAPVVTLGLADGSGHGVSVYALRRSDVRATYPKFEKNSIIDEKNDIQFFIYYSDTTSIDATLAQNTVRQNLMAAIANSFTLIQ